MVLLLDDLNWANLADQGSEILHAFILLAELTDVYLQSGHIEEDHAQVVALLLVSQDELGLV